MDSLSTLSVYHSPNMTLLWSDDQNQENFISQIESSMKLDYRLTVISIGVQAQFSKV